MAMQSPSSSFSHGFTYQVFISFKGTDTRHCFTGNLYKALHNKGIHTFIDKNNLQRGDEITTSLVKAIEESRILIPVFSANYASSSFCLDELVHIIHCYKTKGRLVLPVFIGVEPTNVRHHTGSYGEDLTKHEERFQNNMKSMERLHQWKITLTQAANLSGYHFSNEYEYEFIDKIVQDISDRINRVFLHVAKHPVGLQSQVQQVKLLLDNESKEGVHMVGLYGTGGLGKSTLAKEIYNRVADHFEGVCFLHKVRENSTHNNLKHLQEELLSKTLKLEIKLGDVSEGIPIIKERLCRKKILLVLDDVDKPEQLEALAGGLDWFGHGSRVIITTRDKQLLDYHEIERAYAVKGMFGTEALELLGWMAFKNKKVPSSYEDILNRAVAYASGLPLALEVVGSSLFGKSKIECKSTLDKYERVPHEDIQKILKVSFDVLDEEEQSVFLDIACFFKGCALAYVEKILHDHYGHCIKSHIRVLVDKSLIKLSRSGRSYKVTLHDLMENMGKEIVRQESCKEPGERSRLWCREDIIHVLQENTGSSKIEMIYMNFPSMESVIDWNGKAFEKMTKLKTLILENVYFSEGSKYLPSSLRILIWRGFPSKSLSSCLSNKTFDYMKVLKLDHCKYLTHIPNVSCLPNLEIFSFVRCEKLITIDDSVWHLNKLEILNAKSCINLKSFPPLRLASLKKLELSGCGSLKSFPELLCKMTNMKDILLFQVSVELPSSFQNLTELRRVTIRGSGIHSNGCRLSLPKDNDKMNSIVSNVENLNLQYNIFTDECISILLKWCANVKYLDLSHNNNFKILPECLNGCHLLRTLKLDKCTSLEEIRGIPPNLEEFSAFECESLSSSSRRKLLSQKLHEAGCTEFYLPNGTEGIPDWFEHQSKGHGISLWFRKEIPSICSIFLLPESHGLPRVNLFVNGGFIFDYLLYGSMWSEHAFVFDLKLGKKIKYNCLNKEWIHVELKFKSFGDFNLSTQMGIHMFKKKRSTEEDVIFTNPYGFSEKDVGTTKTLTKEVN